MIAESTSGNLPRVLIIDDEVAIRKFLRTVLSSEEFLLYEAENAHTGLSLTAAVRPDVILLDLGLPDLDGLEVIKRIRDWSQVPIIVLSVREREEDKIAALDAGADDYLTKPFGVGELLARIRAAMRRLQQELPEPVFISDDLEVNLELRRVMVKGKDVQLTPTEYDLLKLLVSQAGKVLTHRHILNKIWGPSHLEQPHVLRVNISNLRRKIELDPAQPLHITTELGVGYRLV
ncbi:two-component system, OmpR family, KDP operon response regulator KdpE [Trichlorobacter thiogenes]|uniref:Two-component system, OmpR family, KDP operon response regulator KdpE n=1 Tax=Trichlorobacter thiogenes TaxID=115783 RepID=A0A1T4LXT0_9BACT|nr:response regulator [Trichlorobacter thiogenes]SJZ59482.1 two-component system, OmpR family, KDP operon response regulator KdpE [Trichlorobacter thiogenes]